MEGVRQNTDRFRALVDAGVSISSELSLEALRTYLESCKEGDDGALRDPVTHRRVAAVEPVDIFGHPVHLERVREITSPWRIPVVSDTCEALGSRWRRDDGTS